MHTTITLPTACDVMLDEERYPSYQHWLTLAAVLGLGDEAIPPDEMRVLIRDGSSTRWWWAWWD